MVQFSDERVERFVELEEALAATADPRCVGLVDGNGQVWFDGLEDPDYSRLEALEARRLEAAKDRATFEAMAEEQTGRFEILFGREIFNDG